MPDAAPVLASERRRVRVTPELVDGLNDSQREAVLAVDGPVLCIAGAGSGKTRVLTHRIAHLIRDHDVDPFAILAITFTNKAAREMRERVGKLVGSRLGERMWVTTFHSACARIMRREAQRLGYTSTFTIYDAQDSTRLVTAVMKDLGVTDRRLTPRGVQNAISSAKDELVDFETYAMRAGDHVERQIAEVYRVYQDRLHRSNAFDFDDLIVKTVELFELFPEVLNHYRERFQYVLVDEYQDTNRAQYHLVNLLAGGHRNVMVVGDADQCLPPWTTVKTAGGSVPIHEVQAGDALLGTGGRATTTEGEVTTVVSRDYYGPLITITADGRTLSATPNHLVPTRFDPMADRHFVYLMYRGDRGFRVGTTKGARPAYRGAPPQAGYFVRTNQEHADAVWVLRVCDDLAEARYWEAYYAATYGLPTACFDSLGRRVALSDDWLARLYDAIDTRSAAKQLMHDLHMDERYPHHRPQGGRRRQSVNLTMFEDTRPATTAYHRIQWSSNRGALARLLEAAGYRVRHNGKGGWRVETSRKSYAEALRYARGMADAAGLEINQRLYLDGRFYSLQPMAHLHRGMAVLTLGDDGRLVESIIDAVEENPYEGRVIDLEIAPTHTYVADGILVHNSVYAFRGATIRNILDFEHDYPDATVIKLTQNYRSTQNILDAANAVIRNNVERQAKELWTDRGAGVRVVRYSAEDERDEAAFVAEEIERLRPGGTKFGDIAVFYRTNAQSRVLEEVFVRVGTPYRVIGGVRFYERKEIKDLLAYLRLLVNPADDISAKRVINEPRRGIGAKSETYLDLHAGRERVSFLEACRDSERVPQLAARQIAAVTGFVGLLDVLRTLYVEGMPVPELIEEVWNRTGYMKELQAERTIEALGREENLRELQSVAREHRERDPDGGLEGFLESVTLVSEQDELPDRDEEEDDTQVTFMTLHNAKGLEFPVVFLVGLEDGVFPHVRSLGDPEQLEEERRLCYVGLTRAQDRLYVVHAKHRSLWGGTSYNPPSRFLRELPDELVEVREGAESASKRVRDREVLRFQGEEFRVGERVRHAKFGRGLILELAGEGESAEALLDFDGVGRKRLLLAYAPLARE